MAASPKHTAAEIESQLKAADDKLGIVRMVSGKTAKGEDFFAYVCVRPSMYEEFSTKVEKGERMNLELYGKIMHKGFGAEPSEDVQRYMEERYGLNPNFSRDVIEALKTKLLPHETPAETTAVES